MLAIGVGAVGYIEDERDDKELVCSTRESFNTLIDSAVRTSSDVDPEQIEVFRDDLLSHLPNRDCEI